jgi:tetratricopeptide (TPR) repeat protein
MTSEEAKEAGRRLFHQQRHTEAVPLLELAVDAFPEDESLWQELVLGAHHCGQYEQAVEFAKQGVHHHTRSGWLWRQLGSELTATDRLEEAKKAFDNARGLLGSSDEWLWRYLATLHQKRKNLEEEIEALENLRSLGKATSTDLNQLGIAYYSHRNFAKALECYRFSADSESDTAPLFNMGLVFAHPDISQDIDAVDAYRRALLLNPRYDQAKQQLEAAKQKLIPLAASARETAAGLVRIEEHFQFFLSPFEALAIGDVEDVEAIDVKVIQRAKKRLLQEIDLNDGKVSWLDDCLLDKARALTMDDALYDEAKRHYHWAVFQNKPLLRFLTRGDIEHFLYSDDYFPHETLRLLDEDPEFRNFLSKPFAHQYNLLLTRAVEGRVMPVLEIRSRGRGNEQFCGSYATALPLVEVLFGGRRWVKPEDEDACFEGASRYTNELITQMHALAEEGETRKVDIQELQQFLDERSIIGLFNLLPAYFRLAQRSMVSEIRSLAITCHNSHADSELSAQVLGLCKLFRFKGAELDKKLEEDFKTIGQIISGRRRVEHTVVVEWPKQESSNKVALAALVIVAAVIVISVIATLSSPRTTSRMGSYGPRNTSRPPAYRSSSGTSSTESGTVYRVPSYVSAELERDSQAIDREKAKAERLASQLDGLSRDIERERLLLDQTSQFAVDEFNRRVNSYNSLLESMRAQQRVVNQMVANYNEQLRKYGR